MYKLSNLPKTIIETDRHLLAVDCEQKSRHKIKICSLVDTLASGTYHSCVNALISGSAQLIRLSCKKESFKGEQCITRSLPTGGFAVWSSSSIQIKAAPRDKSFSRTLGVTTANEVTLVTQPEVQFTCNGIIHRTNSEIKDIYSDASSHIDLDLNTTELVNSNIEIFGNKLQKLEYEQTRIKKITKVDSTLSKMLGVHEKHESVLRIIIRTMTVLVIITLLFFGLRKLVKHLWHRYYMARNRRYVAHLNSNRDEETIPTARVVTTQP
jgi:hypothetical protein